MAGMSWASVVSREADSAAAVAEVIAAARRRLDGGKADLAILFVSPHHAGAYDGIAAAVAGELGDSVLIGCSGGGVIGGGHEVEQRPAIGLMAGVLPGVTVTPLVADMSKLPESDSTGDWCAALRLPSPSPRGLVLLPDPFSFDSDSVLPRLDQAFPNTTITGGLASGAGEPGNNALFSGGTVLRQGVVGVSLEGDVEIDSIVAQGCRPIGDPMFVTSSEGNVVRELDGQPGFEVLRDVLDALPPEDLALARQSLFVGLVMRRNRETYGTGDFLIRNLLGVDPESGVVGVGGTVEEGAVLQFHLRDAATSAEDLRKMLDQYADGAIQRPSAALLFSCLGRGQGLYGRPGHDSELFRERVGDVPLGGFFCNGEIGPVQGCTYLHGYTSSFAVIRPGARH